MKLKLSKSTKSILLLVNWVVGIGSILALVGVYTQPKTVTKEQELFTYYLVPELDYKVHLIPNNLYEDTALTEESYYLANLIHTIEATFTLDWQTTVPTSLTGEYQINAKVRGYVQEADKKQAIWSKDYPLIPPTQIEGTIQKWQTQHQVPINYNSYRQFAEAVKEKIEVTLPAEILITLEGHLESYSEGKKIKVPLQTSLTIPLEGSYFQIAKAGVEPLTENITEPITQVAETETQLSLLYVMMAGLSLGVGCFLFFGTQPLGERDRMRKERQKILREHGSRMAGIHRMDEGAYQIFYEVSEIGDLVKIADEIEQPILYLQNKDLLKLDKFYVANQNTLYYYSAQRTMERTEDCETDLLDKGVEEQMP